MRLKWLVGAALLVGAGTQSYAQKAVGSVSSADATVSNPSGVLRPVGGRVSLVGNETVTAKDHMAAVSLARGGEVRVCQSTGVHLSGAGDESLLLALDRGAMEVRMKARSGDVVMTPDLRFTLGTAGSLDLEIRVMGNGDTCVDNRGHKAPMLQITDAFGEANYELKAGQHVTFEHGSLREVVDRETMPCGCPPDERKSVSLAEAAIAGGAAKGKPVTPEQAAAAHPFPSAVSEGLAAPSPMPAETPGVTHVEVSSTLAFDPSAPKPAAGADSAGMQEDAPAVKPVAEKKSTGGPLGAVGRFFKRLFVR